MAYSLKTKKIYDVFLSFRGADLRNNFIGHLYQALHQNGIYTFRDNEELKKGDQLSPVLMKAIEESCIAIIVFSDDYASSTWCLEELAKIIECKERKNLIVLPVFFKVDPREVREGRKSYRRSLAKHESKFRKDPEKVKRWKKALSDAGNLSGWHLIDGDESKLIQEIVDNISSYLDRPLHVAKHPVDISSQVIKLQSILNLESNDGVLMVGLWGQGGIGKTCLAKALYNAIYRKFEDACFLANVRETSTDSRGLFTLQEKMLNELLPRQRLKVSNVDEGINLIQRRLGHKKVFLILDDVDALRQLDALAGEGKWFGNGSRIIVTTRNKQLLTCHRIDQDHVYEVKALNNIQAHELLSKHAFQTQQIRTNLVDSALKYAKGLPLALEVLGSLLCGTTEDVWESTMKKLSRNPDKTIIDVLKVSFDGLDENEKEIFLHIASFFKGWKIEYTKKVLDSCDLETIVGFDTLIKRSLMSIEDGILEMHDLIQVMGRDIVNQECRNDPRRRSRLWLYNDVVDVLSRDMGDCAIKAIVLKLPEPIEMHIGPDTFTKMRWLRLLIFHNVHDSFQGPICLPNELRWLEWPGCALQISKSSASPTKLVGLDMSEGNITGVLKQFKDFLNLKYINFSQCKTLIRMPDLSCTPNLQELNLRECVNLVEVHKSIANHDKLEVLELVGCDELCSFPNELKSKNLQFLDLRGCTKFERFPDIPHKLEALGGLYLQGTAIKGLPVSIGNLVSLKYMYLDNCQNLISLPSSIYKLQNLNILFLNNCTNLTRFPKYEDLADSHMEFGLSNLVWLHLTGCNLSEVDFMENLSCCPLLEELQLSRTNITRLPTSISERGMSTLDVTNCHQLQEIPELHPFLSHYIQRQLDHALNSPLNLQCDLRIFHPGREMPQWVLPLKEFSLEFMASEELYDKLLGVAFCFVFSHANSGSVFRILWDAEGGDIDDKQYRVPSLDSDHIWLEYIPKSEMWNVVNFGQIDGNYTRLELFIQGNLVEKVGLRIICNQLGDDLKAEIRDNQLIDLALLYEVGHELIDSQADSPTIHKDCSMETDLQKDVQDCQRGAEEQSHKLFSLEARGLLIQLAEMSIALFARCFCC